MTSTIKTVTTVTEQCPWCENEVELEVEHPKQFVKCPECGRWMKPCSLCDCDVDECMECAVEPEPKE